MLIAAAPKSLQRCRARTVTYSRLACLIFQPFSRPFFFSHFLDLVLPALLAFISQFFFLAADRPFLHLGFIESIICVCLLQRSGFCFFEWPVGPLGSPKYGAFLFVSLMERSDSLPASLFDRGFHVPFALFFILLVLLSCVSRFSFPSLRLGFRLMQIVKLSFKFLGPSTRFNTSPFSPK